MKKKLFTLVLFLFLLLFVHRHVPCAEAVAL